MSETRQHPRIAILGWGSLLRDKRPDFDEQHGDWLLDGPALPLEFSRVSTSRGGVLTLAIDTVHGTSCRTVYTISKRRNPDDAIADPRCREGTIMRHVGFYFRDGSKRGVRSSCIGRRGPLRPDRCWHRLPSRDFGNRSLCCRSGARGRRSRYDQPIARVSEEAVFAPAANLQLKP